MSQFLVRHFLDVGWYLRLGSQLFTVKLCFFTLYAFVRGGALKAITWRWCLQRKKVGPQVMWLLF